MGGLSVAPTRMANEKDEIFKIYKLQYIGYTELVYSGNIRDT